VLDVIEYLTGMDLKVQTKKRAEEAKSENIQKQFQVQFEKEKA
jgi:hypothetical protein